MSRERTAASARSGGGVRPAVGEVERTWTDYLAALERRADRRRVVEHLEQRGHHARVELRAGAGQQLGARLGVGMAAR